MQPRFVGRLGLADAVTVANAALGFLAAVAATVDPGLAARLLLLASIADGLDGVIARKTGGTPAGEYLDSLADVASFGVAPAALVFAVARQRWGLADPSAATAAVFCVPALFVAMAVVRLGLYTAYDVGNHHTEGVPSTLAGTVLAAAVLAGVDDAAVLLGAAAVFSYLMVTRVTYPDLYARDALGMGAVQALAILLPAAFGRAFPRLLLAAALAYLVLGPRFYWRSTGDARPDDSGPDRGESGDTGADDAGPEVVGSDSARPDSVGSKTDAARGGEAAREVEGKRS